MDVMKERFLAILGSTGSIGESTLDVVSRHPEHLHVVALAAGGGQIDRLAAQVRHYRPRYVAVANVESARHLRDQLGPTDVAILMGEEGVITTATLPDVDTVVAAIVGAAGLRSTLAAVSAGKRVALANKESMVIAGPLVRRCMTESGAELLPVDSEHSAVFQTLAANRRETVRSITLTASGGPFRDRPFTEFPHIRVEEALVHPNWSMGAKVTIDSATLMNKGLELIEARWLFDIAPEQLRAVIHRESIVHALVTFVDGAVMAQLAHPDMRAPIAYALAYPTRIESGIPALDLATCGPLSFSAPDTGRFPCLTLAQEANRVGGSAPAVLNAANEVAVTAFLSRQLPFLGIAPVIEEVLTQMPSVSWSTVEELLAIDGDARRYAMAAVHDRGNHHAVRCKAVS
ncbi:MAG: 1-deoxy-D-xylulose-5-phosphate reductoisomerase [Deltaproteobacteria bacterium]|nr:1-deoxy-D-xylulose-5-phosphate reductoisomerase [Deltaproteobacteria bacterium]